MASGAVDEHLDVRLKEDIHRCSMSAVIAVCSMLSNYLELATYSSAEYLDPTGSDDCGWAMTGLGESRWNRDGSLMKPFASLERQT